MKLILSKHVTRSPLSFGVASSYFGDRVFMKVNLFKKFEQFMLSRMRILVVFHVPRLALVGFSQSQDQQRR